MTMITKTIPLDGRLTLKDVYDLSMAKVALQSELVESTPTETATLVSLSTGTDDDSIDTSQAIAGWAVMANAWIQEKCTKENIARILTILSAIEQAQSILLQQEEEATATPRIATTAALLLQEERPLLGSTCLAVYSAATMFTPISLGISITSIEAAGAASVVCATHGSTATDTTRRSVTATAVTIRASLADSRYTNAAGSTSDDIWNSIPFTHGPATDALEGALKSLQTELLCTTTNGTTATELAAAHAQQAIRSQVTLSRRRTCALLGNEYTEEENTESTKDLMEWVATWKQVLEQESAVALNLLQSQLQPEEPSATAEAETAAAPALSFEEEKKDPEFAGKSDSEIRKILKKRAEKAAKKLAKQQKKKQNTRLISPTTAAVAAHPFDATHILTVLTAATAGGVARKPKLPKGTRDYYEPRVMHVRQQAFSTIRRVFASHGAVEIDTPVFELKDTLTGKYGEDSKLIYDLADQGGDLLALRYDLTVPFARFLALHGITHLKRCHMAKVYRRDTPALAKGRYREFYQCDFDIAGGTYGRMMPDAECVAVACEILGALPIGPFALKLNHRRLLDAILDLCGVPESKFRTICSAVDKLDKEPWSEVKREMVEDKGLEEAAADRIGEFVLFKGKPKELHKQLLDEERFGKHTGALDAMEDLRILFEYLEAFGQLEFVSFDLSLARGLDYYTGVIYEAVSMSGETQVGSIGGGGRYDNLVGMFQGGGKQTPCVGVSIGIERVFTLMEARFAEMNTKHANVNVLVASTVGTMIKEKMEVVQKLWKASISAEFTQHENPKLKKELVNALDRAIPFMVVIGEDEWKEGKCQLKDLSKETADWLPVDELVPTLRSKGVVPVGCEFAVEMLEQEAKATIGEP